MGASEEPKVVYFIHWNVQKSNHCVLMEVQKGAQCTTVSTYQTKMVVGSKFHTKGIALLMYPSGTIYVHPTVTVMSSKKLDFICCTIYCGWFL